VTPAGVRVRRPSAAAVVALLLPVVVLGPALGAGLVQAYDLVWSPDPRFTPFTWGLGTPAPRAVPSDAAVVVLGAVVSAPVAQKVVLWGVLALAGLGAARLARSVRPGLPGWAVVVAVLVAVWNPFVLERLVVGQWTVLAGYAAVPFLLVAAARVRLDAGRGPLPLAAGVALCGVGGANTLVVALAAVVPVLLWPRTAWRALLLVLLAAAGSAAAWALPALGAGVTSPASGAQAFAPRADTPLGEGLSLLLGGAFWNPATHPGERSSPLVAIAALVAVVVSLVAADRALRVSGRLVLAVPAFVGLVVAVVAAWDPFGLWTALVSDVPGAAVLRDTQKLVAPLVVLTAVGAAVAVHALASSGRSAGAGPALALLLAVTPVLTLPSLAWGAGGRLVAVEVPAGLRSAADRLSVAPAGTVGVLPWGQYRRYPWNGGRVSLSLVPRMVDQRVLFDDSLPLASGRVAGEDPAAGLVAGAIAAGSDPVEALRTEGARYLLVERAAGVEETSGAPEGASVLVDTPELLVVDLDPTAGASSPDVGGLRVAGWVLTATTVVLALVAPAGAVGRRRWVARTGGYSVVRSAP
jgi:hypothetical protein